MKKATIEIDEVLKILIAVIVILIVVYILYSLKGQGSEKIASIKSLWRSLV